MENIGLHSSLVRWTANYLLVTDRSQHVFFNGFSYLLLPVVSGVPQGSVLGPLLFLIYIDGCANTPINRDSDVNLFADDLSLFRPIQNLEDYDRLQEDIHNLATWVNANLLTFNAVKCKYFLLSRRRSHTVVLPLYLHNKSLERVFKYKYLGIILTADPSWSDHIQSILSKAKSYWESYSYRQFYSHSATLTLLTLYRSIMRLRLEYASPVWNLYLDKDIKLMESVQKMALKLCTKHWSSSYEENLASFTYISNTEAWSSFTLLFL